MRKSGFIFIFAFILYFLIATIFPIKTIVGKFGEFLGKTNYTLFGFFSYFFVISLFFLTYLAYKKKFNSTVSLRVLGGVFLFLDLLFLQSLIFNEGVIGNLFVNTLKQYIGVAGVSLLIFVIFLWSMFLLNERLIFDWFEKKKKEPKIQKPTTSNAPIKTKPFSVKEIKPLDFDDVSNIELDEDEIRPFTPSNTQTQKDLSKKTQDDVKEEIFENKNDPEEKLSDRDKGIDKTDKSEKTPSTRLQIEPEELKEDIKVSHVEELEDTKLLLSQIETGEREKPKDWKFPPLSFLEKPQSGKKEINEAEIDKKIKILIEKLKQFKIEGDVVRYYVGPVVTTFEFKPLPHIKVSKILALQDDLAMALKAQSIRIQAPIPGKDVVGIEIPNDKFETIYLREILESEIFTKAKSPLTLALGKDIVGCAFVTDLKKLPHLLIAGTTGSGKSVGINAMILSLLYRNSPDELKFVMIDPKMLEFSIYNDIPHLLTPVITEPKKAIMALNSMVKEMERRYKLMAKARVKNIEGYNAKVSKEERMPYIVIIIDELADLMMTSGKDVEYSIARLAQMARASGIHLIVATQRPSVDVVTGLIKANLPSRISFKVGQKIDSKVILDQFGAESLLGRGDMLFTPPGITGLIRLHAPYTSEEEIEKVVEFLKSQKEAEYDTFFMESLSEEANLEALEDVDELFEEAKEIVLKEKRTSISYLQRRLNIGYNRAANIIEQLERAGILSSPNSKGQREILI